MNDKDSKYSDIIYNSPVEFIIVGPFMGRDKVILRSHDAKLDLVGLAIDKDYDKLKSPTDTFSSMVLGLGRNINVVESIKVPDLLSSFDDRSSSFRFSWVGYNSKKDNTKILDIFNRSILDIRRAIMDENASELELSISSLLLYCSTLNDFLPKKRRAYLFILLVYLIVALVIIFFMLIYKF